MSLSQYLETKLRCVCPIGAKKDGLRGFHAPPSIQEAVAQVEHWAASRDVTYNSRIKL